jgi:hypothetical protein
VPRLGPRSFRAQRRTAAANWQTDCRTWA